MPSQANTINSSSSQSSTYNKCQNKNNISVATDEYFITPCIILFMGSAIKKMEIVPHLRSVCVSLRQLVDLHQ